MSKWISVKDKLPPKNNWRVYAVVTNTDYLHKFQICWITYSKRTWHLQTDRDGKNPINVEFWKDIDCNFDQFEKYKHKY